MIRYGLFTDDKIFSKKIVRKSPKVIVFRSVGRIVDHPVEDEVVDVPRVVDFSSFLISTIEGSLENLKDSKLITSEYTLSNQKGSLDDREYYDLNTCVNYRRISFLYLSYTSRKKDQMQ